MGGSTFGETEIDQLFIEDDLVDIKGDRVFDDELEGGDQGVDFALGEC